MSAAVLLPTVGTPNQVPPANHWADRAICRPFFFSRYDVIPAKAGIQRRLSSLGRWAPAFAGVTK
jgi:hypothetical protein